MENMMFFSRLLLTICLMTANSRAIETVNVVDFCGQTVRGDGMVVNSHTESRKYYFVTMATDCHLTMQAASPRDKVQFHFRFFLVYSLLRVAPAPLSPAPAPAAPLLPPLQQAEETTSTANHEEPGTGTGGQGAADPCHAGSYVQFYDGRDRSAPPVGPPLCGKSPPRPVLSTGNHLTLRLVTRGTQPRVDFVGDFTSFRLGFNQSECRGEPYFTCRNGKCIPLSLVCDDKDIDNCGDGSDLEENLTTGCRADEVVVPSQPPTPILTPPPTSVDTPTGLPPPADKNCGIPNGAPSHESVSVTILYTALGVLATAVCLCWCFVSPGWLLWRLAACRFLPCCNAPCASCQMCARGKERRNPAKVSPHTTATAANANSVAV